MQLLLKLRFSSLMQVILACLGPMVFCLPKNFYIFLAFNIADEGYYKYASWALKWISKFLLEIKYLSWDDFVYVTHCFVPTCWSSSRCHWCTSGVTFDKRIHYIRRSFIVFCNLEKKTLVRKDIHRCKWTWETFQY